MALTLPFLIPRIHSKLILLGLVIWAISKPSYRKILRPTKLLFVVMMIILSALLGLIHTSNGTYGISIIETLAVLLIIPLMVESSFNRYDQESLRGIFLSFVVGVLLLNLTSLFFISYDLWDPKNLQSNLIVANNVIVRIHPTFLSMYISFCMFFLVDQYFPLKGQDRARLGWVVFSLLILFVFLFWLNSRAGIIAFVAGSIFFIYFKWKEKCRVIGFVVLALFMLLITVIPFSRHRFFEAPLMVLKGDTSGAIGDPSVYPLVTRLQIYRSDLELLKWPEILYGYGTGDFRDELQERFAANDFERPLAENMDSHSEYFAQLHRHGIIGLALFVALLVIPFRHAMKYGSPLLGAFIILFSVTALFENVFSAQKGVTFFALFCPILWIYAERQAEDRKTESEGS
ncbi:MAG: O-antigen ligase family protein [Cyclobacteriaceae bacterium]